LEAGSVDLTVTSPPYDNLRTYNGYTFNFEGIAQELYRVTKAGGVVVWVVGDASDNGSETGTSFRQALYFKELGFNLHDTMIYMKAGPSYPSQDKYYQVFEYMFILSNGKPKTFNPIKDRENRWFGQKWSKVRTRRKKNGDLKSQIWYADEGERLGTRFNIWQYAVGYGYQGDELAHQHPASFPEDLVQDHILSWSNPGDMVLDPLMGSGTTGKMATLFQRDFIGIELSDKYYELAKKRIAQAQLQIRMDI
jgi:site-specific DNA-methyltransferase (adenine-specific)